MTVPRGNRQRDPAVQQRWEATAEANLLAVCPVVALELLASSRNEAKFAALDQTLTRLPTAHVTRAAGVAAWGVTPELRGDRRIPAADYLIAAAGRAAGVLHYDRHFRPAL